MNDSYDIIEEIPLRESESDISSSIVGDYTP